MGVRWVQRSKCPRPSATTICQAPRALSTLPRCRPAPGRWGCVRAPLMRWRSSLQGSRVWWRSLACRGGAGLRARRRCDRPAAVAGAGAAGWAAASGVRRAQRCERGVDRRREGHAPSLVAHITPQKAACVHGIGPAQWAMPLQSSVAYGTLVPGTLGRSSPCAAAPRSISLGRPAMAAVTAPPMMCLTPRPYQYEAVAALLAAAARGVQRPLLVLPTGTGKTIVFALLVQRRGGRSLILAHRDELIQQAVDKLRLVDPTLPLGVVQATHDEHTAPTVVASVQTLSRRTRLARLVPDFQTIVIDEAHHAPAPTYRRILDYCRAWHPDGPLVVGVTATPERGDHHSLRPVFDRIVYQKTLLEMMQAGYLVDLRALQVLLQADFDALRTQQGDFVEAEIETLLLAAHAPAKEHRRP